MTLRRARVARHKVHVARKNQTGDKAARRTPKELTFGKKSRPKPECKSGFKDRDARWQLHLKNEKRAGRIYRKTVGLEFVQQAVGISSGLRNVKNWALWRSRPSPKRFKGDSHT
jgi:hypothetical protein